MSKKKKRKKKRQPKHRRPERPLILKWEFDTNIPTDDFLAGHALDHEWQEAVEDFVEMMECDRFLVWEAVMAGEQGLRLTRRQKEALNKLISFGDDEDDQVLTIDELPRPSEPWYVILNKIAPHLLIEPFRTFDAYYEHQHEGWSRIVQCLNEHAHGLSLPEGVTSPVEVVPVELRRKLELQTCFDALSGLGQAADLTLENPEQREYRIEDFIHSLRGHKDAVRYFDLSIDSLLTRVIVPERDKPILIDAMQQELGITSTADPIADHL